MPDNVPGLSKKKTSVSRPIPDTSQSQTVGMIAFQLAVSTYYSYISLHITPLSERGGMGCMRHYISETVSSSTRHIYNIYGRPFVFENDHKLLYSYLRLPHRLLQTYI